jgi:N-methylhydantoinase A
MRLDAFDPRAVAGVVREMREEAHAIVRQAAPRGALTETLTADMRYVGQGHEVVVALPPQALETDGRAALLAAFERAYAALYNRSIPGLAVEILTWTLVVAERREPPARVPDRPAGAPARPAGTRRLFDPGTGDSRDVPVYDRPGLKPGAAIAGPAVIVEDETTTVVGDGFDAAINALGYIVLQRRGAPPLEDSP